MLTQNLNVRADKKGVIPVVHMVQGDTGRKLTCIVQDYDIPSGSSASLSVERPDGNVYVTAATISNNNVSAVITSTMLNVVGIAKATMHITSSGSVVSTFEFVIKVEEAAGFAVAPSPDDNSVYVYINGTQVKVLTSADLEGYYTKEETYSAEEIDEKIAEATPEDYDQVKAEVSQLSESIVEISKDLNRFIALPMNWVDGFYVGVKANKTNSLTSNANYCYTEFTGIKGGDVLDIQSNFRGGVTGYAFYDRTGTNVGYFQSETGTSIVRKTAIVPQNAESLRVGGYIQDKDKSFVKFDTSHVVDEYRGIISEFDEYKEKTLTSLNKIASDYGNIISPGGYVTEATGHIRSDYIKVNVGDTINYSLASKYSSWVMPVICMFDVNKSVVRDKHISCPYNQTVTGVYTVELDGYVIIQSSKDYKDGYLYFDKEVPDAIKRAISDSTSMPSYWKTYMDGKIASIQSATGNINYHGVMFSFITDLHLGTSDRNSHFLLDYIKKNTGVCNTIIGGDILNYETGTTAISVLREFANNYIDDRTLNVIGNHDAVNGSTKIDKIYYNSVNRFLERVVDTNNGNNYYFYDNHSQKVRFIFLDDAYYTSTYSWGSMNETEWDWYIDALNSTPDGWNVIVVMHCLWNGDNTKSGTPSKGLGVKIVDVANKYNTRANGSITPNNVAHSYDFANGKGKVICFITGHLHLDYSEKINDILCIGTTTDCCAEAQSYDLLTRTSGTISEHAFDIFMFDFDAKTIKTIRIGAGSDRQWTY